MKHPAAPAEVDDHPVGVDDHPSDVADEGGGDGVGGVDRQPAGGVAAQMGEVGEVDAGDVAVAGHRRQLGVVDGLVDDDVDDRFGAFGVGEGGGGSGEDGGDGVGAALAVGAFEQVGAGVVAEAGTQFVPFGVELGLRERVPARR